LLLYKFKIADFFDSKQKFVQKNRGFATFYEILQQPPLFCIAPRAVIVLPGEDFTGYLV